MKPLTRRHFATIAATGISAVALGGQWSFAGTQTKQCTLWQLPDKSHINSYVLRTAGNELIVIDGGKKSNAAELRKFIMERGGHVHAWFISHTHYDHVDALTAILNEPGGVTIDRIYASLPDDEWMKKHQTAGAYNTQMRFKAALKKSEHKLLDLSPGQKIAFTGVTFEILSTVNPDITNNAVNNQSAVWRVDSSSGNSVLFLGDLGEEGGEKLLAGPYGKRVKADYVQMAHHGQAGVNEAFYKAVDPKYCLWPTPGWLWNSKKTPEVRAWMEKLNVEKHYVAKDGLQRIDF